MSRDQKNRFRPTLDVLEDRLVLSSTAGHVHHPRPHHTGGAHHSHSGSQIEVHHANETEAGHAHTSTHA